MSDKEGVIASETQPKIKGPIVTSGAITPMHNSNAPRTKKIINNTFLRMIPELRATTFMSFCMASHFFGYEFARAGYMGLFTSDRTGFTSPGAFPAAITCASPFSAFLIFWYGRQLDRNGPRLALRNTTVTSSFIIFISSLFISALNYIDTTPMIMSIPKIFGRGGGKLLGMNPIQIIVWTSFIFQNSYVSLLCTQHWSFMGSVLTASQGATYFASIAGLSSISSTIAGAASSRVVDTIGLTGLLTVASVSLLVSMLFGDVAYAISDQHKFNPSYEMRRKDQIEQETGEIDLKSTNIGIIKRSIDLFIRVPILGALFIEVVSFQTLSTLLNICFVAKLREAIQIDTERAGWTGNFYALVNGTSALLQFAILPLFMKRLEPRWVWRIMPLILLACIGVQCLQIDPSIYVLSFCMYVAKTLDYSFRQVLNQIIFVSLDFESRYLGKEIIGILGNRLGKSGISVVLSVLPFIFKNFSIRKMSSLITIAALIWSWSAYRLSCLVPTKYFAAKQNPKVSQNKV